MDYRWLWLLIYTAGPCFDVARAVFNGVVNFNLG